MKYIRVELSEGVPVQFLGVYALRWQPEWGQPSVGFIEAEDDNELAAALAAKDQAEREAVAWRAQSGTTALQLSDSCIERDAALGRAEQAEAQAGLLVAAIERFRSDGNWEESDKDCASMFSALAAFPAAVAAADVLRAAEELSDYIESDPGEWMKVEAWETEAWVLMHKIVDAIGALRTARNKE